MKAGWQYKTLAEVSEIKPSKSEARRKLSERDVVSFVPMEDLGIDQMVLRPIQERPLAEVAGGYTYFADGDVLLAKITPCFENGKLGIASGLTNGIGFGSSEYIVFRPDRSVAKEWLYYFLSRESFRSEGAKRMTGAVGHKRVPKEFVEEHPIPIPPLPEQLRIVGILDEAFDGITTAKANAEKNLQNARALFESHLQSLFAKRGPGWVDRKLGDTCVVERGSSPRPIKKFFTTASDGVNWIKIGDTKEGEKYIYSTAQKITPDGAKQSRYVKENDFILTNSMSFGRPYIVKTTGYIHDGWFVLRLNQSINTDYFYYLLASEFVRSQFNRLASGAIVLNISSDLVKQAVLPIPPRSQQDLLADNLERLSRHTQHLETIYRTKIAKLDLLKNSLLNQAFTGAL